MTFKDLVVDELADDLALMAKRAGEAEADRDAYKLLVSEALTALYLVTKERDQLRLAGRGDIAEIIGEMRDTIQTLRDDLDAMHDELRQVAT